MKFTKMQGTGNDFIMMDGVTESLPENLYSSWAKAWCDRHFGIGADGLIVVLPSETHDFKMRIFNADGSEAEMCGNGMRCCAHFVQAKGLTQKTSLSIETLAGIIKPEILETQGNTTRVKIDMGLPRFEPAEIPVDLKGNGPIISHPIQHDSQEYFITAVSMGNPHSVIEVEDTASFPVRIIGPKLEYHKLFPNRTNIEFIQILSPTEINMRVWERGSGETLACGTGACAAVVAGIMNKKLKDNVTVHLLGGDVEISWVKQGHVFKTGPSAIVFEGTI